MAGINRLGKGPAKPGTMRPADPNKYKTMDIFSEGTEGDKDYARMVQDIEDTQQNHSGWLFGRGAFDKGDLLYLRDEEEKRRFAEQELRESELRSFARMRKKTEALRDELDPGPELPAEKEKYSRTQADIVKGLLRVKAAPRVKLKQENGGPAQKRAKTEPISVKQEQVIKNEDYQAPEGLGGLLGGYGTDSEDEEPTTADKLPSVKIETLPLPEILVKREKTVEAARPIKQEEPPPLREAVEEQNKEEEEEEVDYSNSSDDE